MASCEISIGAGHEISKYTKCCAIVCRNWAIVCREWAIVCREWAIVCRLLARGQLGVSAGQIAVYHL